MVDTQINLKQYIQPTLRSHQGQGTTRGTQKGPFVVPFQKLILQH